MRIFFRADADSTIGLGHLVRSLALAAIVRPVAAGVVMVRVPSPLVQTLVAEAGLTLLALPELSVTEEADYLVAKVLRFNDILVLDGYGFDTAYRQWVRASGCRLVCIDDLHEGFFPADLIINHSPGITVANYRADATTQFCLGPAFSLLRPAFLHHAQPPRPTVVPAKVLVCFGGADPLQLTARMLAALLPLAGLTRIGLLLGGAAAPLSAINALLADSPQADVTLYRNLPAAEMVEVLCDYDAVICPASTILIETLVLGLPAITGYYVANQCALASYVHDHQQAYSMGDFTRLSPPALLEALVHGLAWISTVTRQPYAPQLNPNELRQKFAALIVSA